MSSRYDADDSADSEPPPLPPRSPLEPAAPFSKRQTWAGIIAVLLASAVGVGAAFGFDVCALLRSVGLELTTCKPGPPAPVATEPAAP